MDGRTYWPEPPPRVGVHRASDADETERLAPPCRCPTPPAQRPIPQQAWRPASVPPATSGMLDPSRPPSCGDGRGLRGNEAEHERPVIRRDRAGDPVERRQRQSLFQPGNQGQGENELSPRLPIPSVSATAQPVTISASAHLRQRLVSLRRTATRRTVRLLRLLRCSHKHRCPRVMPARAGTHGTAPCGGMDSCPRRNDG